MKYMTFNSSCAYAGLANLLALHGHDTEDAAIALDIGLPYMLDEVDGCYLAGAMLQGAAWFDLYLRPRGFRMIETLRPREETPAWLTAHAPAMLGLRISEQSKHAVICTHAEEGRFHFINNKWAGTDEPDTLTLSADELLARLDDEVMLAMLEPCPPQQLDKGIKRCHAVEVLRKYRADLLSLCRQTLPVAQLQARMNTHFRALLVDEIAMMNLLGATDLAAALTQVQRAFLTALRGADDALCLADVLPMAVLKEGMDSLDAKMKNE